MEKFLFRRFRIAEFLCLSLSLSLSFLYFFFAFFHLIVYNFLIVADADDGGADVGSHWPLVHFVILKASSPFIILNLVFIRCVCSLIGAPGHI